MYITSVNQLNKTYHDCYKSLLMNSTGDRFTLNLDLNPESDHFFIMNLHDSIINSSLLTVQSG